MHPISSSPGFAAQGFTVVEMVTVIILLGILSIGGFSAFVKPSAFAPLIVTHELVAQARLARRLAASRQDAAVSLSLTQSGSEWVFETSSDIDGLVRTENVSADHTALQVTNGLLSVSIDATTSLVVEFDRVGNLSGITIGADTGDASQAIAIQVTGDTNQDACIFTTGYAAQVSCG